MSGAQVKLRLERRRQEAIAATDYSYRAGLAEGFRRGVEKAADCLPTTWLDPLLTGPDAVAGGSPPEIEAYTKALADRIRALRPEGEK